MDILTGFDNNQITRRDFSSDWQSAPRLNRAVTTNDFLISAQLGGTRRGEWDSSDRVRFSLLESLTLNLSLSPQTITEVVKFDSAGNASVVGSVEYGSNLQVQLAPGRYGLSFFVEGDLINYSVSGQFS